MIVKMKKITILVEEKETNEALKKLRKLGVVHIKNVQQPKSEKLTELENNIADVDKALSIIGNFHKSPTTSPYNSEEIGEYVKEIVTLERKEEKLQENIRSIKEKISWFEEWGRNILPASLKELKQSGVFIKLYKVNKKLLKRIPQQENIYIINQKKGKVYLALVSPRQEKCLNFPEVDVPEKDWHCLQKELKEAQEKLKEIKQRLEHLSSYRNHFGRYKEDLVKKLKFYQAKFGMGKEERVCYLQGFCPIYTISKVDKLATSQRWGLIIQEPDNLQEVPVLIKNPWWIDIISPVLTFMGTLPGYNEYDISFCFLLFFSLFFAMLIGDAGYGLIFLIFTFLAQRRWRKVEPKVFSLLYVLSISTIIWGAITGTWFGWEKIARLPFLNSLVIDKINSFVETNYSFMMYICFLIGGIHLTIAHTIIILRFINSLFALSQAGWICILWGVFFIAKKLVLSSSLPKFAPLLLISGIILVTLFSTPQKGIFKGALISLSNLPLKIINSFSDIISYLRLFAVGYATVVVATTFNNLAVGVGFAGIGKGFIAALILFFGHCLNILLGLMAVIVHGLRLNMLEFSTHLNMEWSGQKYTPFRE